MASRLTLFPSKKAAGHSLPQSFLLPSLLSLFPLGKNGKKSWTLPHPRELQFQRRFILPRSHILEISLFSSLLAWQRAGEMGKVLHHGKSLLMSLKANLINGIFLFLPANDTAKIHTFFFFRNIVSYLTLETSLGICLRLLFGNNIFSAAETDNAPVMLGNA